MTVTVSILNIASANCQTLGANSLGAFDVVKVSSDGSNVFLYLEAGKGRAVADAINAAIEIIVPEAAQ
jgi:hypothetical protein